MFFSVIAHRFARSVTNMKPAQKAGLHLVWRIQNSAPVREEAETNCLNKVTYNFDSFRLWLIP